MTEVTKKIVASAHEGLEALAACNGRPTAQAVKAAFAAAKAAEALLDAGLKARAFASDEELEAAREPLRALWAEAWSAKNARSRK